MYQYILFDLDGTLSDSKPGICKCVERALNAFGIFVDSLDVLEPFIGPPLRDSFKEFYGFEDEDIEKAILIYRERYSTVGLFENDMYEGIDLLLKELKENGRHLAVASSKPKVFVERILEHFDILKYFDVVMGSNLDGTMESKLDVLNEALRLMFDGKPVVKSECVMIGDRKFDIEASNQINVPNIGVTYGFGSKEELKTAGAEKIVDSVSELRNVLMA